jgi:hypothetical protein
METGLQLLMRDGAVYVAFNPRLDAIEIEYAELVKIVELATTKSELRRAVESAASRWGHDFHFDGLSGI